MPEYQPMGHIESRDPMVRAYLECAEWCGLDDESREALELAVAPRWDAESERLAAEICSDFEFEFDWTPDDESEQAGIDIWLTRNRHGAGFWDGDWLEPFATKATEWCHAYGEAYVQFDPDTETLSIVD